MSASVLTNPLSEYRSALVGFCGAFYGESEKRRKAGQVGKKEVAFDVEKSEFCHYLNFFTDVCCLFIFWWDREQLTKNYYVTAHWIARSLQHEVASKLASHKFVNHISATNTISFLGTCIREIESIGGFKPNDEPLICFANDTPEQVARNTMVLADIRVALRLYKQV